MASVHNLIVKRGEAEILKNFSAEFPEHQVTAVSGRSGCGKTTVLRTIGGFVTPDSGDVFFGDEKINNVPPHKRAVNTIFQKYALFPHLNVYENIAFGMRLKGKKEDEIQKTVTEMLHMVNLNGMAHRGVGQLSGGQQQRVALARALVLEPGVLLFDEPLSNLDAKLRVSMRTEIRRIQQATGITAIYVTHDQSEAMALSDSIIIMNKGVVAQIGSPQEIYYHPNSEFVADFIGEANFLKGKCVALEDGCGVLQLADTQVRVAATENMTVGEDYTIVLRPESAGLVPEGNLKCRVVLSCFMGAYQNYHVMVGDTLVKLTDYNPKNHRIYQVGETCALTFEPDGVHVL